MKLQTIYDGRVVATVDRTVLRETDDPDGWRRVGRLPVPERSGIDYRLKTSPPFRSLVTAVTGRFPAVNVWSIGGDRLLASAGGWLFLSRDGGREWTTTRRLPPSSAPMGVLPSAVCTRDGTVYVGEYPLDGDATPRILESEDGETWSPVVSIDDVRHVHAVQVDPYTDRLWVTTGDSDGECRIARVDDDGLDVVGGGDQSWRAVELAFTPSAVLWGVDSVYEELNPIHRLPRQRFGDPNPSPDVVHTVSSSVYYAATVTADDERWVLFSTALESGADSTGPDSQTVHSDEAGVVAASSASDFTDWYDLASYRKRSTPVERANPWNALPTANAYVFLEADSDRGVFLNPYNTDRDDGTIRNVPLESLAELR